jgi:hypothetical protein
MAHVLNASNPGMTTFSAPLSQSALHWRALGVVGFGVAGYARINLVHCLLSAGVVACGFSAPERWPNLFGSPLQAWSVQRFWRCEPSLFMMVNNFDDDNLGKGGIKYFGRSVPALVKNYIAYN